MKIYIVQKSYWEIVEILAVYKTKQAAKNRIRQEKKEWKSDNCYYEILEREVINE